MSIASSTKIPTGLLFGLLVFALIVFTCAFVVMDTQDRLWINNAYSFLHQRDDILLTLSPTQVKNLYEDLIKVTNSHPTWRISGFFASILSIVLSIVFYGVLKLYAVQHKPPPAAMTAALFGAIVLGGSFILYNSTQTHRAFHSQGNTPAYEARLRLARFANLPVV
jgi:high-affinity nickel permease